MPRDYRQVYTKTGKELLHLILHNPDEIQNYLDSRKEQADNLDALGRHKVAKRIRDEWLDLTMALQAKSRYAARSTEIVT